MKVHEYQAKEIFRAEGLPVPTGKVFTKDTLSENDIAAIGKLPLVVKAQVHAGGRGKAGGVKIVKTVKEAFEFSQSLIGKSLVTYQTAGKGQPVNSVLVESASILKKELYLAAVMDREEERPCVVFSEMGGMDIEEVAKTHPDKIMKLHFDPVAGVKEAEALKLIQEAALTEAQKKQIAKIISVLSLVFVKKDISLLEINPLGILEKGEVFIVDSKAVFDDNALFRHPEIAEMRDTSQEDSREVEAKKFDLSYVGLDGNIGCMVNGAGLAMATMDLIKLHGGEPANFLDVGGGASVDKVSAAFKIILVDPNVKAILVNIFGGIMKCDVVAQGIVAAAKQVQIKVPLVVRLEGTNVKEGLAILKSSGLNISLAENLTDAAKKVVAASQGKK